VSTDRIHPQNRQDLDAWYAFVLTQAHHLAAEPDIVWQQGANLPTGHPVERKAAELRQTVHWPARPWFEWISKPANEKSILLCTVEGKMVARALFADPLRRYVFVHNLDNHVLIFKHDTGQEVPIPLALQGPVTWIGISPTSGDLVWSIADGSISCGSPLDKCSVQVVRTSGPDIRNGIVTASGRLIVLNKGCSNPELWTHQNDGWESRILQMEGYGFLTAAAAAPRFAMVQRNGVAIIDEERAVPISFLEEDPRGGEADWQCPIALSPDGRLFFAGIAGGHISVWDVENCKKLRLIEGHPYHHAMDGKLLEADRRRAQAEGHGYQIAQAQNYGVVALAANPRGRFLASASNQGQIGFWDYETGEQVLSIAAHDGSMYNLCFSADGSHLVSSGFRAIKIWKVPVP
jgi:WD40 repeat protein